MQHEAYSETAAQRQESALSAAAPTNGVQNAGLPPEEAAGRLDGRFGTRGTLQWALSGVPRPGEGAAFWLFERRTRQALAAANVAAGLRNQPSWAPVPLSSGIPHRPHRHAAAAAAAAAAQVHDRRGRIHRGARLLARLDAAARTNHDKPHTDSPLLACLLNPSHIMRAPPPPLPAPALALPSRR